MTYNELQDKVDLAWAAFFDVLEKTGDVNIDRLVDYLDSKDCFNDVADCVMYSTKLESSNEE